MCPHFAHTSSHAQSSSLYFAPSNAQNMQEYEKKLFAISCTCLFTFQRKNQQVDFCTLHSDARHILAAFLSPCQKFFSTSNLLTAKLEISLNLLHRLAGEILAEV